MSKRDERIKRMQAQQIKQTEKNGGKSWFENFMNRGTRGTDAPIGLGTRTQVNENPNALPPLISSLANEVPYIDPLYQDAPAINPQALAAAYGDRVAKPTTNLQGAPISAPVQRKSVRDIRAKPRALSAYPEQVAERVALERRGMPMAPQRAPLSVHNIMDYGEQSNGYDW